MTTIFVSEDVIRIPLLIGTIVAKMTSVARIFERGVMDRALCLASWPILEE